jgi:transcriptional regulator with XRE-family HTH domain
MRKSAKKTLNLVGPQIRRLRDSRGMTQAVLAEKLQLIGWDVSRVSLAKLEAGLRWVSDCELLFLAKALGVGVPELYPAGLDLRKIGPQFRS